MIHQDIPVVILCGGMGTRMKEETEFRPKPLVEIGDKPIVWHIMSGYAHYGYDNFILCLGYRGEMIKEYFLNYETMSNDFTINLGSKKEVIYHNSHAEENWDVTLANTGLLTNTGGRIKRIASYIKSDYFFVTYGDGVADVNLEELLKSHRESGKIATLTGLHPFSRYGVFELDQAGEVAGFKEKPRMADWVSGGFFVFNREFFDYLDDDCVLEKEPLENLVRDGQLNVYQHQGFWHCMDTYKDAKVLNEMWNNKQAPWKVWDDEE